VVCSCLGGKRWVMLLKGEFALQGGQQLSEMLVLQRWGVPVRSLCVWCNS
jgi:hypothetical protein